MYTTQKDAAAKGIITKEMEIVAKKEGVSVEFIRAGLAKGTIVIPANKKHTRLDPEGIGEGLRTKVNVNLGISRDCPDVDKELDKVRTSIDNKADAIMDLSSFGKTEEFRKGLIDVSTVMVGTVPIYDAVGYYDKELKDIDSDDFLDVCRRHAEDGVDFLTLHVAINQETASVFKRNGRLTNIVSRGGSLMYAWMEMTGQENPFFARYDEVLDICAEYDVTISLGDAMRPGSIADGTDGSQIHELIVMGELTKRAWEKNVQVMIEGPGHIALNEVVSNIQVAKKLTHNAPLYVLGPVVTDVAPGYDHITSAIGGAVAVGAGVDFLCYVTPAEHLRLPTVEDVKEGLVATRIAAHAGDIAKGIKGAREWDNAMSQARRDLDWEKMFSLAMDEEKARRLRAESVPELEDSCTMCGKMCSMRNINKIMKGEDISIM